MKKLKLIFLFLICVAGLCLLVSCAGEQQECLEFVSNGDGTCYVAGIGTCTGGKITVPEKSPEGDVVTGIGSYAFSLNTSLTELIIPEGVTDIGSYAFYRCTKLQNVAIPASVNQLGTGAFYLCGALTKATIPEGVTKIENDLFYGCNSLQYVSIPQSVVAIGDSSFFGCSVLGSVTFPEGLQSIGKDAFYGCRALKTLLIPQSVTWIGGDAFYYCTGLEKINIEDLDAWLMIDFYNVTSNPLCYGHELYLNGAPVTDVTMPAEMTEIKKNTFAQCTTIKTITLHTGILNVGNEAFYQCTSLTDVYFTAPSDKVPNIDVGSNNEYLKEATIHYESDKE